MTRFKLRPRQFAFVVGTRVALALGVGLLVSARLPSKLRRAIGATLVGIGAVSTIPAMRLLAASR
jgi:hypothetical protein